MSWYFVRWEKVQEFYDEGNGRDACMQRFCFTAAAWYKAIREGKLRAEVFSIAYDWDSVQRYHDEGYSFRQCKAKFGFTAGAWKKARLRGQLRTRPLGKPLLELLLLQGSRRNVRKRLLREGWLRNECYECGMPPIWRGRPLSLQLDHIDGNGCDHRLENLRMLCPNCHSQTDTFGVKNRKDVKHKSCGSSS